jgi:hypothetical protein
VSPAWCFCWYERSSQASVPSISSRSYPAPGAAISGGRARILAHSFPVERTSLEAAAEEAGLSRVLRGMRCRFDGEMGPVPAVGGSQR